MASFPGVTHKYDKSKFCLIFEKVFCRRTLSERNKSSYFRVKLKRIEFELYTEPDLTWTLTDLSLTASPLPSPV